MPAKPCMQYTGSKMMLAPQIVDLLGPHGAYVEPFFGSGAVLFAKPAVSVELVNDLNHRLVNFYRVLREPGTRGMLIDALTYTPYARAELEYAVQELKTAPTSLSVLEALSPQEQVRQASLFFVAINQDFLGSNSGRWTSTMTSGSGHSNASKWNNYRTRLSAVAERLQQVQIDCSTWQTVMGKLSPDPGRAVYLDPPYMHSTRNGSRYDMDNMSDEEHTELLEAAMQLVGPTVISAYPSDLYDDILGAAGWTAHTKNVNVSSGSGNGSSSRRTEVLWANPHCVPQLPEIAVAPAAEVEVETDPRLWDD